MKRLTQSTTERLDDELAERVRRNHDTRIAELAAQPTLVLLGEFTLADATNRVIPHGLGREPRMVYVSPPRDVAGITSGAIVEVRSSSFDRSKFVVLRADDWAVSVVVDVAVIA